MTDFLIDRIAQHLGHPRFDPHGDPIPTADGNMEQPATRPLSQCAEGYEAASNLLVTPAD